MTKTTRKSKPLAVFTHSARVEVTRPDFEPFATTAYRDLVKLGKGTHRIPIGTVAGGCCGNLVYAVIKDGAVVGIRVQACKDCKRPSKDLAALLKKARRKTTHGKRSRFEPVPVKAFFASAAAMRKIVISAEDWCVQICISAPGIMICYRCCLSWPEIVTCSSDIIATGRL